MTELVLTVEEILAFNRGDQTVFRKILDHRLENVTRYVYVIINHSAEAEDIAMRAFMAVWNTRATLKSSSAIQAFLFKVAKNKAHDYLRHEGVKSKYRSAMSHLLEQQEDLADIARILDTHTNLIAELMDFVNTLPLLEREVFKKHYIHGVQLNVLTKELNRNKNTITSLKTRALAKIRQFLQSKDLIVVWLVLENYFRIF